MDRMQFEPGAEGPDRIVMPAAPSAGPVPMPAGAPVRHVAASDEFETESLDRSRWIILNEDAEHQRMDKGCLVIDTQTGDFGRSREQWKNLVLQQAPPGDFTATVEVMIEPEKNFEQAFLIAWQDPDNYVKVTAEEHNGPKWFGTVELLGKNDSSPSPRRKTKKSFLRLRKKGDIWQCFVSNDGTSWEQVGADWEAKLKEPYQIGVGALSPGSGAHREARFERFEITRTP
jgi:regulation of enolase protein 1 (concanavalin A-like superfamily)